MEYISVDFFPVDSDVSFPAEKPEERRCHSCIKDKDLTNLFGKRPSTVAHDSTCGGLEAHSLEQWEVVLEMLIMLLLSFIWFAAFIS